MSEGSYRESHLHKGLSYHETFSSWPYRATIWRMEQRLLLRLVREHFFDRPPRHLDFACGTGRILGYLAPYCRSTLGVDVSASMLDVARRNITRAEIMEADITRDEKLGEREFDLITAFRFFPNAESELRRNALGTLARHLSSEGVLVFNNHKNTGSLRRRAGSAIRWSQRRRSGAPDHGTMSDRDARTLISQAGLGIYRVYHLAVLPFADRTRWLPQAAVLSIEDALSRIRFTESFAQNLVYVCRRLR